MLSIEGRGGELYLVSEEMAFAGEPLEDAGNGFDWRLAAPSLRLLSEEPLVEYLDADVWHAAPVIDVWLAGGSVSLARCLRWTSLRASGTCRLLISFARAESFRLRVEQVVIENGVDANGARTYAQHRGEHADCVLARCEVDRFALSRASDLPVLAVLPFQGGCFRGIGRLGHGSRDGAADRQSDRLKVTFDDGEVTYGR